MKKPETEIERTQRPPSTDPEESFEAPNTTMRDGQPSIITKVSGPNDNQGGN